MQVKSKDSKTPLRPAGTREDGYPPLGDNDSWVGPDEDPLRPAGTRDTSPAGAGEEADEDPGMVEGELRAQQATPYQVLLMFASLSEVRGDFSACRVYLRDAREMAPKDSERAVIDGWIARVDVKKSFEATRAHFGGGGS